MTKDAKRRVSEKRHRDLSGFILKNRSPSCGMERVKVYIKPDTAQRKGVGLFASAVLAEFPDLPVEEEGRLTDATLRENFIERIFAHKRLQTLFGRRWARGEIVEFHSAHKVMLMAHSPEYYRRLGKLVAGIKDLWPDPFKDEYRSIRRPEQSDGMKPSTATAKKKRLLTSAFS